MLISVAPVFGARAAGRSGCVFHVFLPLRYFHPGPATVASPAVRTGEAGRVGRVDGSMAGSWDSGRWELCTRCSWAVGQPDQLGNSTEDN